MAATEALDASLRPPKKGRFSEGLGSLEHTSPWRCKAFEDIVLDNAEEACYAKTTDTKPVCKKPECKGGHILVPQGSHGWGRGYRQWGRGYRQWGEEHRRGSHYLARNNDSWRTLDESWLDMEAAKDGETLFVNVLLGGKDEQEVLTPQEEYKE